MTKTTVKNSPKNKKPADPSVTQTAQAAPESAARHHCIHIEGAREHNLKNISLDIPRDQLVVV